ncbi:phosphoribosylglycinamide formyltransferase [bacterium Unc6]|nr:phosphoribosylglycinamide formyltransferase [bacterium Unc6]
MEGKVNIAVFCSGAGTNFQAIIDAQKQGLLEKGQVVLMVCDNPHAQSIERAKKENVPSFLVSGKLYENKTALELAIIKKLEEYRIELLVLAGYMRLLSLNFIKKYKNRILNIHPALLPSFPGTKAVEDALNYGVKTTGVTVHFVDQGMDTGPIILQESVPVYENDTIQTLSERIHKTEHRIYPKVIKLFCAGRLKIEDRKVSTLPTS